MLLNKAGVSMCGAMGECPFLMSWPLSVYIFVVVPMHP